MPSNSNNLPESPTDALLHDIRMHQLKLQMQNEELKKSQQELAKTRRRYIDLFEHAPTSYITLDRFGRITNANLEARSALHQKNLKDRFLISLIASSDHQKFISAFNRTLTDKTRETFEVQLKTPDAKIRIYRFTTSSNDYPSSGADVVLVSGTDCTDRFLASNRVQSVIDCSPDTMIVFGEDGMIVDANQQAIKLFCASKSDLRSLHITDLMAKKYHRKFSGRVSKLIGQFPKRSGVALYKIKLVDGFDREFAAICKISAIDSPFEVLFVTSIRDITRERIAIKTAIKSRMAALRASKIKSQFLANMSHELRTPITSIMGFSDLLSDEYHTKEARKYLDSIRKNSQHLRQVINDILDISSIESGNLKIKPKSCNIREIFNEAYETMRINTLDKKLKYELYIDEKIPELLEVDSMRVKQILLNLIGNAIKFTDIGYVIINTVLIDPEEPTLEVSIKDSGCGIEPQHRENLFNMFYQADSGSNRRFSGTGLGLAVSKNLAKLMNGDVRLHSSQTNVGSEFIFSLKVANLNDRTKPSSQKIRKIASKERMPLRGLKILVVEDGEDIQLLLKSYLNKAGATVEQAVNGLEGYEKAKSNTYDAVLMDIQMPIIDGLEATWMLRQEQFQTPIIAVSANAYPMDVSRSLNSGCNDHISKPVQYDNLITKIQKWTSNRTHLS